MALLTAAGNTSGNFMHDGVFGQLSHWITGLDPNTVPFMGHSFNQLFSYVSVYAFFGVITVLLGLLAILISPLIKRLMGGIN